jgi:8-oxo-dGTP diphosphatase
MMRTCLCLIRRHTDSRAEVLLGLKKTGFGVGKWVGIGGHIEDGEKPEMAAVREVMEETSLAVPADALQHLASIEFLFPARPSWDQTAEVYVTWVFEGEPADSDEVSPRWFGEDELPLGLMWDDAKYWLPAVLAGQHVGVTVTFADDCATVASIEPALPGAPARQ